MHRPIVTTALAFCSAIASAAPQTSPWPTDPALSGADVVAASALAGRYAVADRFSDTIEIRDVRGSLLRTITRAELSALLPWAALTDAPDGPGAMAWSDSGRLLFILVHDAAVPGDGLPGDAVLRYDAYADALTLHARVDMGVGDEATPLGAAHFRGRLYIAHPNGITTLNALRNTTNGSVLGAATLPNSAVPRSLAMDREGGFLFAASDQTLFRAPISSLSLPMTSVGPVAGLRAIAYSDQFGGTGQDGLFAIADDAGASRVWRISPDSARGLAAFAATPYFTTAEPWTSLAATADGALIAGGGGSGALRLSDDADLRLPFEEWLLDELRQVVSFCKGLISPDGEPHGWVIDADVQLGWSRFHPATPDGACWAILALLASDSVDNDPEAQTLVGDILERYAGLAPGGIGASASGSGIFRHWIDPLTGQTKPGWSTEFALYSTMKLVLAAERAMAYFPDDQRIQNAGSAIVCRVTGWDAFIEPGTDAVYLTSSAAGTPTANPRNFPFTEGILFVEQASVYGGPPSDDAFDRWIDRSLWPTASYLSGQPITGAGSGSYLPAFITAYSLLLQHDFRLDSNWIAHATNLFASNGAWTDDNGPRYFTVFSAGTTKSEWGGYHADDLANHPGNVTGLPSLMAMSATGDTSPAVAAYHAYRRGARQTFLTGATILYRRSDIDRAYSPNSAGLPDVVHGALALAELLQPGFIDSVLARPYSPYACPPDVDTSGETDLEDLYAWHASPTDLDRDAMISDSDRTYLQTYLRRDE